MNYSYYLKPENHQIKFEEKKFLCNISSNKYSNFKSELYSERIKVIEFYNKKYPQIFDLFGFNWDSYVNNKFLYNIFRQTNNVKLLRWVLKIFTYFFRIIIFKKLVVYRGVIKNKYDVLKNYKYSICFENYYNNDGYVTEKIFDCFKCKVVPIYYGYDEIQNIIPENTFIDYRKFESLDSLNDFLLNINESEYYNYLKNAQEYLKSSSSNPFNVNENAKRISNIIYDRIVKKA